MQKQMQKTTAILLALSMVLPITARANHSSKLSGTKANHSLAARHHRHRKNVKPFAENTITIINSTSSRSLMEHDTGSVSGISTILDDQGHVAGDSSFSARIGTTHIGNQKATIIEYTGPERDLEDIVKQHKNGNQPLVVETDEPVRPIPGAMMITKHRNNNMVTGNSTTSVGYGSN